MELRLVDSPDLLFDGKTTLVMNEGTSPPEEVGIFLFLFGVAIWLDILSSFTKGKSPSLLLFHPHAISCTSAIQLENIMGCKNWAILQLGRISALHENRTEALRQGCFNTAEFEFRADVIRQALRSGLAEDSLSALDISSSPHFATPNISNPDIYIITRLFTLAALILLHLVVHGYQLQAQEMRSLIVDAMAILRTRMPAYLMHAIICPLFIVGTVVNGDEKHFFRHTFLSLPILDPSLEHRSKILPALEEIWQMRDTTPTWSWQDTTRSTGGNLLLV